MTNSFLASGKTSNNELVTKTYMMLALSLIPTILGAVVGMKLNWGSEVMSGTMGLVAFFGLFAATIVMIFAMRKAGDTPMGVSILMLFTFVMGLFLSASIERTLKLANGSVLVIVAAAGTMTMLFAMSILNKFLNRDLSWMGKGLFIALIALVVMTVIGLFFPSKLMVVLISGLAFVLFSVYLLYDLNQLANGGEDSYVMATLSIYLDLLNIFTSLLNLLGISFGDD